MSNLRKKIAKQQRYFERRWAWTDFVIKYIPWPYWTAFNRYLKYVESPWGPWCYRGEQRLLDEAFCWINMYREERDKNE